MAELIKGKKKLPIWGFLLLVIVYLAIIKGIGLLVQNHSSLPGGQLGLIKDVAGKS